MRMRPAAACEAELAEIEASLRHEHDKPRRSFVTGMGEIFTERRYVMPFVLACIVLGCNQATGINSLLQFMSTILQKAGLDPVAASGYGTAIKIINSAMTVVAIILVERKGRVFLLKLGTGGIVASLCLLAAIFYNVESKRTDVRADVAALVSDGALAFDLGKAAFVRGSTEPLQISILYRYGDRQQVAEAFMPTAESKAVLDAAAAIEQGSPEPRHASRRVLDDAKRIRAAQFIRITANPSQAGQPLEILRAHVGPIPSRTSGLLTALCIASFIAFFAVGPGVCGWLALSELMPNRIRSVGMGVALLINQGVGATIAAAFLPIVGNHGFYAMFLFWAGCTVVYFITAAFFLPETKGRTLEEIETFFTSRQSAAAERGARTTGR
jgi:hypothetical protein